MYVVKEERHGSARRFSVNHAGIKKLYGTEAGVAASLGVDAGELRYQLARRKGMTFVIKRNGRYWYV